MPNRTANAAPQRDLVHNEPCDQAHVASACVVVTVIDAHPHVRAVDVVRHDNIADCVLGARAVPRTVMVIAVFGFGQCNAVVVTVVQAACVRLVNRCCFASVLWIRRNAALAGPIRAVCEMPLLVKARQPR